MRRSWPWNRSAFVYRHFVSLDAFLDGPEAKPREAVHLNFANEKVRPHELFLNLDVADSEAAPLFRVLSLDGIVRVKLTASRDKDRTHLRDMLDVGLIDATWNEKLPAVLAVRLRQLLGDPEG